MALNRALRWKTALKRLKSRAGMTLAELIMAAGLVGLVGAAASALAGMLFRAGADIQKEFAPLTQANLAIEAIYQRLLRAPPIKVAGKNVPFQILNSGKRLVFGSATGKGEDEVELVGNRLLYRPAGGAQESLLQGVEEVSFSQIPFNRLGIQLTLEDNRGSVGSSVFPRNTQTPRSIIN